MPSAQNVLLAIHIKRTDNVELKNPILSYIRETYSDREAEDAVDDLVAIQTLRNELVATQAGSQLTAKDSYIKYFKCLTSIETRFPISHEKGNVRINFPWTDAFRHSKKTSQPNIHFEKAAVLFNVAAVLSQQALQVDRATADGLKEACKLFQEAAGMFGHLKENEASKIDNPRPVDLSPECLGMMEKLMMAQAQVRQGNWYSRGSSSTCCITKVELHVGRSLPHIARNSPARSAQQLGMSCILR
eukprot:GHRQ01005670.1.p1 GENE.GHRQ01005670.1~~GHRQ01005670.1.p1  ORF type:complete len:245 (+),score=86.83 GHRQ01005670.1:112-846(+)